jgi:GR25 family glycosyltransferase involved in LPS biosynthesis
MRNLIYIYIFILLFCLFYKNSVNEYLSSNDNVFDIYVISLRQKNRLENIEKQQQKIKQPLQIFDAVKGDKLDLNKLIGEKTLSKNADLDENEIKKKRQVGCYLSHFNIYKKIKDDNRSGYTIIFEDDFILKIDDLIKTTSEAIEDLKEENIDFDILYLGNLKENHGVNIKKNLYYADNDKELYGTYGYLINNKNIDKIIKETKYIDKPLDNKFQSLTKTGSLNTIVKYPTEIDPWGTNDSTINDPAIENFSDKYSIYKY